ncbi:phosphatase PAP2 family protein [Chitiniphilus purpureus]|uniref:Phosphatase PAP2 family protein n=1 Tax=Chitiniphilus purpureus TaxID=2981137 RepID=A0ABY6DS71_9NEIS|nr:phosphatase PAP2 family protein [Chitiniphilus sp. CD1]UXY17219.1 phosphatase PAP2 family protein [Chitiniphilus sp. CD1]
MRRATRLARHRPARFPQGLAFWLWHLALPLALGALLWLVYPQTGLDDWVVRRYFDPSTRSFPLQHSLLFGEVLHTAARLLVVAVGLGALGLWFWSFLHTGWRAQRRRSFWIFLAMLLASGTVSMLKARSIHHCPWDLAEYGGYAPHLALFADVPARFAAGHCFPAGHASGGFAMMAFYFGLRDLDRRKAAWALALGLSGGWAMGWTQTMRGAHFPSHTLWSAWVVWMVLLALYVLFPPAKTPPADER